MADFDELDGFDSLDSFDTLNKIMKLIIPLYSYCNRVTESQPGHNRVTTRFGSMVTAPVQHRYGNRAVTGVQPS